MWTGSTSFSNTQHRHPQLDQYTVGLLLRWAWKLCAPDTGTVSLLGWTRPRDPPSSAPGGRATQRSTYIFVPLKLHSAVAAERPSPLPLNKRNMMALSTRSTCHFLSHWPRCSVMRLCVFVCVFLLISSSCKGQTVCHTVSITSPISPNTQSVQWHWRVVCE